jgi:hypothetical protein
MSLKRNPNIYQGYEFTNVPYNTNEKFSVYIPKEKESYVENLSQSHRENNHSSHFPGRSLPKYLDYHQVSQENDIRLPMIQRKSSSGLEGIDLRQEGLENAFKIEENEYISNKKEQPRRSRSVDVIQNKGPLPSVSSQLTKKKKKVIESLQKIKNLEAFRAKLYFDERTKTVPKSTIKSAVIENLIREKDFVMSNKDLIRSILKLKSLSLLKNPTLRIEHFKGGKVGFVTNDYHLRETNPGYVRNTLGTFFTR